tara:strand:- start:349 stop:2553 length:2205 start_codon:yes stop_codon:yes gene_type:complete
MLKYLIFVIIGIIVYLLYNRNDTFSVGIPWCIVQNDAPDVILNSVNIATLPPNGMLLSNISPNLANLGLSSDQFSVKRCNMNDTGDIVLRNVSERLPYCSVNFGENTDLDILTHYLEQHPEINRIYTFLTEPPTIPEYNINSINLNNASLEDLILLKEAAEGNRTRIRNRVFLLTNIQRNIIDRAIDLKRELSINPDLNRVYDSLFNGGVFDPNRLDTLSNPDIDILITIINLVYLKKLQLLLVIKKYLIDNPDFATVYNRFYTDRNDPSSLNIDTLNQTVISDIDNLQSLIHATYTDADSNIYYIIDRNSVEYRLINDRITHLEKIKYLTENPEIATVYDRLYTDRTNPSLNIDALNQTVISDIADLQSLIHESYTDADRNIYYIIDQNSVEYTLINDRITELSRIKYLTEHPEIGRFYTDITDPSSLSRDTLNQTVVSDIADLQNLIHATYADADSNVDYIIYRNSVEYRLINDRITKLSRNKYLTENPEIATVYDRFYTDRNDPSSLNRDALNQTVRNDIADLQSLIHAKYVDTWSGVIRIRLIDKFSQEYRLINARIFALTYKLETNIIAPITAVFRNRPGMANIVVTVIDDVVEFKEYQVSSYGLSVITRDELSQLGLYYLIRITGREVGLIYTSIQITGELVGIGGNDDIGVGYKITYLSGLLNSFTNPRYLPMSDVITILDDGQWRGKNYIGRIKTGFQDLDLVLNPGDTQKKPNKIQMLAWFEDYW